MRCGAVEPTCARALRVEETRRGDYCPAVVEERHKLYRACERAEHRFRDLNARAVADSRLGMDAARASTQFVRDFARARERVNQFCARPVAVREQARDASAVDAAARRQKVVARAPRDAAEFEFALGRRFVFVGRSARERETCVALDALARGEEGVALLLARRRGAARLDEQVLDLAQ